MLELTLFSNQYQIDNLEAHVRLSNPSLQRDFATLLFEIESLFADTDWNLLPE